MQTDGTFEGRTYKMPFEGHWEVWTDHELETAEGERKEALVYFMQLWRQEYVRNRLAYFLPHGEGREFVNDRTHTLLLMTKMNQGGGTTHGIAFLLFRAVRTDPEWHCFKHHGIQYVPFAGPKRIFLCTWSWDNMAQAVWPALLNMLPRAELGVYAPDYGNPELYPEEDQTKQRAVTFSGTNRKPFKLLVSGTEIFARVYTQPQFAFETTQADLVLCDEQVKERQFDGMDERGRTRKNFQIAFTLTGHKLPGQADTGKAGWIYRKLYLGTDTKGHTLAKYRIRAEDVPDVIYPKKSKEEAYQKWVVDPQKNRDKRAIREGQARWNGEFEGESELVLENWDADTHVVPRFEVPKGWTRYRGVDHGRTRPCAATGLAVTPWGDAVLHWEYYETNKTIFQNVSGILAACGNMRQQVRMEQDGDSGNTWQIWEEKFNSEEYAASVLDGRSFAMKSTEREINVGQVYNDCGLFCLRANCSPDDVQIECFQSWLRIDWTRDHVMVKWHRLGLVPDDDYQNWLTRRGGDTKGWSRLTVMGHLRFFQMEIETWQGKGDDSDKVQDANNHALDATKYILMEEPRYMGYTDADKDKEPDMEVSEYTGY